MTVNINNGQRYETPVDLTNPLMKLRNLKKEFREPIAIVGISCRFPGNTNSIEDYWNLLFSGKDVISELDTFDNVPNQAELMDTQQELLMEVFSTALKNANQKNLDENKVGIFIGLNSYDYISNPSQWADESNIENIQNIHSTAAGRIAHGLGLQGPCITIDTAYASSLLALNFACKSLLLRESEVAFAVGIHSMLFPQDCIFNKTKTLAMDMQSKTSVNTTDSYKKEKGCGIVVLKKLSDAKRDNDNILAVIRSCTVDTIIEEAPTSEGNKNEESNSFHIFTLSAKNPTILSELIQTYCQFLISESALEIADIAYTLNTRKTHYDKRIAVVANSKEDLLYQLRNHDNNHFNFQNAFGILIDILPGDQCEKPSFQIKITLPNEPIKVVKGYLAINEALANLCETFFSLKKSPESMNAEKQCLTYLSHLYVRGVKINFAGLYHTEKLKYLSAHKILQSKFFPGACYINLMFSAGLDCLDTEGIWLEQVNFENALPCSLLQLTQLYLASILDNKTSYAYQLDVYSLAMINGTETWHRQIQGKIKPSNNDHVHMKDLNEWKVDKKEISVTQAYQVFERVGLNYGMDFRFVKRAWLNRQEAVAEIQTDIPAHDCLCHPNLLEGCFQVLTMMMLDEVGRLQNEIYEPTTLDSFYLIKPLGSRIIVGTKLIIETRNEITASFELFNPDGVLLGKIDGFRIKRIHQSLLTSSDTQKNLDPYQLIWQQSIYPTIKVGNGDGKWFILDSAENQIIANKLSQYLSAAKRDVSNYKTSELELLSTALNDQTIQGIILFTNLSQTSEQIECKIFLELIQKLIRFRSTLKLWLVTCGAVSVQGEVPFGFKAFTLWGMARILTLEHPNIQCVCIDLDPLMSRQDSANALFNEVSCKSEEDQIALRLNGRWVARSIDSVNQYPAKVLIPKSNEYQLCPSETGLIDDLKFMATHTQPLLPHEIKIDVKAAALNFRDTLNALGLYPGKAVPLGIDCAGIITDVGSQVIKLKIGDSVLGLVAGCFANRVITESDNVFLKPKSLSFTQAATIPAVFVTAYYILHHKTPTLKNKRILIHTASGGLGLAAIQLAKLGGAEVFATAGTEEKRSYLRSLDISHVFDSRNLSFGPAVAEATNQQGIDIVLNTLTGQDFIPTTLSVCAKGAYYFELSKHNIWTSHQIAAIRPDINYEVVALDALSDKKSLQNIFDNLSALFDQGHLQALPLRTYSFEHAISAFQAMRQAKHIGKIVLVPENNWQEALSPNGV